MQKLMFVFLVLMLCTATWAQTGGPDAFGYTWANSNAAGGPAYAWLEHNNPTTLDSMADDWVSGQIPLGFTFPFYGQEYTYIYICSNGIIGFNSDNITSWQNAAIPTADTPNNFIGWFWDDMNPSYSWADAHIDYETITWNGQPAFLISVFDMPEYNDSGAYPANCMQGQCLLAQNGAILVQYDWFGSSFDRSHASVGIENADASIGLQYAYQNAAMFTDDMAIQFYPPSAFENDLAAVSLLGNSFPSLDREETYTVTVENEGSLMQWNFVVQLLTAAGEVLTESDGGVLLSGESSEFTIAWTPADATIDELYARVVLNTDENPDNNLCNPLPLWVRPADVDAATVGFGGERSNRVPLNFYYRASLTETLYLADELAMDTGVLTRLAWQSSFYEPCWDKPVRIWVGETTQADLATGWISCDDLTLVYDGLLDFPAGEHTIQVPFQTFYVYEGGNLVVMVERALDTTSYSQENIFVCTNDADQHPERVRRWQSDVEQPDPQNPTDGQLGGIFANTGLFFTVGPTVVRVYPLSPEGVVYSGEQVTLTSETGGESYTVGTGVWAEFSDVAPDFYTVSVTADGFMPCSSEHVRVEASCDIEVALVDSVRAPQNVACNEHGELTWDAPWDYVLINREAARATTGTREAMTFDVLLNGQLYDTVEAACQYSFYYLFEGLTVGQSYTAGVRVVFSEGETATASVNFTYTSAAVSHDDNNLINGIGGIYPNPFNPRARVAYALTSPGHAVLSVYDVRGRLVRTLAEGNLPAGEHTVVWDGRDDTDRACSSGVYFFRLSTQGRSYTHKALLLK